MQSHQQPRSPSPAPKSSLAAALGRALAVRDDDARRNALLIRALSLDALDAPLHALVDHVVRILDVAAADVSNMGALLWLDELGQYLHRAYGRPSTAGAHSNGPAPSPPDWARALPFPTSIAGHLDQFLAARHSRPRAAHSAPAIAPITLAAPAGSWPSLAALDCVRVTAQSYTLDADLTLAEPGIRAMHDLTTPAPPLSSLAQTWAMQESSWPSLPGWPCTPPFDMGADTADAAAAAVFRSCPAANALWVPKDVAAVIHVILTMPVDAEVANEGG
ncbi:hypothetical protein GGF31_008632 [Allomyces arbusculus]|nr:hypothetical protein GGF31_008632 [Allomyces arbusculus]